MKNKALLIPLLYSLGISQPGFSDENNYRDMITQIKAEQGIWSYELFDPLIGLALENRNNNNYNNAITLFQKVLQIQRVNKGLESIDQIETLRNIMFCYSQLGEWEKADNKQHLLIHIARRNFLKSNKIELVKYLDEDIQWNLDATIQKRSPLRPFRYLKEAEKSNKHIYAIYEEVFGENDYRLIDPLEMQITISRYIISTILKRFGYNKRELEKQRTRTQPSTKIYLISTQDDERAGLTAKNIFIQNSKVKRSERRIREITAANDTLEDIIE